MNSSAYRAMGCVTFDLVAATFLPETEVEETTHFEGYNGQTSEGSGGAVFSTRLGNAGSGVRSFLTPHKKEGGHTAALPVFPFSYYFWFWCAPKAPT